MAHPPLPIRRSSFSPPVSPVTSIKNPLHDLLQSQDSDAWRKLWSEVPATELISETLIAIDEDATVEAACEMLLSKETSCLVVRSSKLKKGRGAEGLFDFADVNAFLTLAATQHALSPDELDANPRMKDVVDAAKAGHVPVRLVANLSDKNPLTTLPSNASLLDLLQIYSRGTHRVIVQEEKNNGTELIGIISDRQALSWLSERGPNLTSKDSAAALSTKLEALLTSSLSSLSICTPNVTSMPSDALLLDAMRLMSNDGLSSLPVVDPLSGQLLSAVSVNDIGRLVIPSQSKTILSTPLVDFVKLIKGPAGMQDGVDKYPIYAVGPTSTLLYAIQMLLATNAHRIFVVDDSIDFGASGFSVTSIVDVLSFFASLANIEPDPRSMQRHRRESSASNASSRSHSTSSLGRASRPNSLLSSVSSLSSLSAVLDPKKP